MLSRCYGTLVNQATPLDQVFLLIEKTRSAKRLPRLHPSTSTTIQPFHVILMLIPASKFHLRKPDHIGSHRYITLE